MNLKSKREEDVGGNAGGVGSEQPAEQPPDDARLGLGRVRKLKGSKRRRIVAIVVDNGVSAASACGSHAAHLRR